MAGESLSFVTNGIHNGFHLLCPCFPLSFLADKDLRRQCSSDCSGWSKPSQPSKSDWELFLLKGRYHLAQRKNFVSTSCCASFPIPRLVLQYLLNMCSRTSYPLSIFSACRIFASIYDSVLCVLLYYGLHVIFIRRKDPCGVCKRIKSKTIIC